MRSALICSFYRAALGAVLGVMFCLNQKALFVLLAFGSVISSYIKKDSGETWLIVIIRSCIWLAMIGSSQTSAGTQRDFAIFLQLSLASSDGTACGLALAKFRLNGDEFQRMVETHGKTVKALKLELKDKGFGPRFWLRILNDSTEIPESHHWGWWKWTLSYLTKLRAMFFDDETAWAWKSKQDWRNLLQRETDSPMLRRSEWQLGSGALVARSWSLLWSSCKQPQDSLTGSFYAWPLGGGSLVRSWSILGPRIQGLLCMCVSGSWSVLRSQETMAHLLYRWPRFSSWESKVPQKSRFSPLAPRQGEKKGRKS